jgi:hypothetical protein
MAVQILAISDQVSAFSQGTSERELILPLLNADS